MQTLFTFPHFFSWVIVAGVLKNFLRLDGFINQIILLVGLKPIPFLMDASLFKPMLFITSCWKEMGWSAIIYLAALSSIDQELFDAAIADGANRIQRILHVTLPGIATTITLLLILAVANTLNAGFDQVFNMINAVVKDAGQIIDTYLYDITFTQIPDFAFSTAVGLFKGVISLILLISADRVIRLMNGRGLYS
jgi:putative aldouronate transport system permease protein